MSIPARLADVLSRPHVAVLSTRRPDGAPQQFHVWATARGDEVLMSTTEGRPKHRNLVHDPLVSLLALPLDDPYANIQVRGRVTCEPGGHELMQELSQHYRGQAFVEPDEVGPRVLLRMSDLEVVG